MIIFNYLRCLISVRHRNVLIIISLLISEIGKFLYQRFLLIGYMLKNIIKKEKKYLAKGYSFHFLEFVEI